MTKSLLYLYSPGLCEEQD